MRKLHTCHMRDTRETCMSHVWHFSSHSHVCHTHVKHMCYACVTCVAFLTVYKHEVLEHVFEVKKNTLMNVILNRLIYSYMKKEILGIQ